MRLINNQTEGDRTVCGIQCCQTNANSSCLSLEMGMRDASQIVDNLYRGLLSIGQKTP